MSDTTDSTAEAITAFHVVVEMLRELDARFGVDFSAAVLARVHSTRAHFLAEGSHGDHEALTEGMEWLETTIKPPA